MKTVPLRHTAMLVPDVLPEGTDPDHDFYYVDISAVDGQGRISLPQQKIAFSNAPSRARRLTRPGDSIVSTVRTYLRAVALIPNYPPGLVASTGFAVLRSRNGDPRFLNYSLRSEPFIESVVARSVGVSYPAITASDMLAIETPCPSLQNQRRIADFLDDRVSRIDRVIAARRTQGVLLTQQVKSALAGLVLDGQGTIPVRRLIHDEKLGLWGDDSGSSEVDVRVARVADFDRRRFGLHRVPTERSAPHAQVKARLLQVGDTLLERSGGTHINPVGCPAYVEDLDGPTVCSNFVSRLRPREGVEGRYFSLVLGALYWTRQQEPHSTQTTGIQNLNTGSYFKTEVPDRTQGEQEDLAVEGDAQIASAMSQQAALTRSIELLTEYKQSLITAAVTGQLDVTTASTRIPE